MVVVTHQTMHRMTLQEVERVTYPALPSKNRSPKPSNVSKSRAQIDCERVLHTAVAEIAVEVNKHAGRRAS
jgi:hypothetical protein